MIKYAGIPCAACGHPFEEKDDIVICPVCGAPHHRSCYRNLGRCALEGKHAPGFSWQAPAAAPAASGATVVCKSCNTVNPKNAGYCQMCGSRLGEEHGEDREFLGGRVRIPAASEPPAYGRIDAVDQWEINGVSAREISAYTGSSAFYFLRQFQLLLRSKWNMSWNWPAFLLNFVYFFYRRMYLLGAVLMVFYFASNVPALIYSIELFKSQYALELFGTALPYDAQLMQYAYNLLPVFNVLRFLVSLLCGAFANKMFLKKALADIDVIRHEFGEKAGNRDYYAALYFRGRPNFAVVIALLLLFLAGFYYLGYWLTSLAAVG